MSRCPKCRGDICDKYEACLARFKKQQDNMNRDLVVGWPELMRLARALAGKIPDKYNTWLLVGTGGFRVGAAVYNMASAAQVRNAVMACIQASHYDGRTRRSRVTLSPVLGRLKEPILIIDDVVESGRTMLEIRKKLRPARADIAVIFRKPQSAVVPDYYAGVTSKWVVFPWGQVNKQEMASLGMVGK